MFRDESDVSYHVVINCQEQYSIWPAGRPIPLGWYVTGISGCKAQCLEFISDICTGAYPLSLTAVVNKDLLN